MGSLPAVSVNRRLKYKSPTYRMAAMERRTPVRLFYMPVERSDSMAFRLSFICL